MTKVAGIPWYSREDYDDIRRAMADADALPDSFAYWLSSAESVETAVASAGVTVVRVPLDLPGFLAWCEAKKVSPDGRARSSYASEMASRLP